MLMFSSVIIEKQLTYKKSGIKVEMYNFRLNQFFSKVRCTVDFGQLVLDDGSIVVLSKDSMVIKVFLNQAFFNICISSTIFHCPNAKS